MSRRTRVWEIRAELASAKLGDRMVDLPNDYGTYFEVAKRYKARYGEKISSSLVEKYLSGEDPFIDPVAIERAMNFDWGVIGALTDSERSEFYARLADMEDPFDFIASGGMENGAGGDHEGLWSMGRGGTLPPMDMRTDRRRRFLEGAYEDREALRKVVSRSRSRRRRARQAQAA